MVVCQYPGCDRSETLPFKCRYCNKSFCSIHRLPENHDCEKLHLATSPSSVLPTKEEELQADISVVKKEKPHHRRKSETIESEYFDPDSHYYTTDKSGQIYKVRPTKRKARDRLYLSMVGDYFSVGREFLDFLLGLLLMVLSYSIILILMSQQPWYFIGFVSLNIILIYCVLVFPKKLLAKRYGFSSRYILSKIGIIINIIMAVSPIKVIFFPGMVVIPELSLMTKKQRGLVNSIGSIITLILGSTYILLGWLLLNPLASVFFINAAFLTSQLVLISIIPFGNSSGRHILKWHWAIFTTMLIFALAIFVGTIILGVFNF